MMKPQLFYTTGAGGPERGPDALAHQRRVTAQLRLASAEAAGVPQFPFPTDPSGRPHPAQGQYWSQSHTRGASLVGLAAAPIGVDVESTRPRRPGLWDQVLRPYEISLLPDRSWHSFACAWTAKEAVLKRAGCGLAELSRCRLVAWSAEEGAWIEHRGARTHVAQLLFPDHILAVAGLAPADVRWTPWQTPGSTDRPTLAAQSSPTLESKA